MEMNGSINIEIWKTEENIEKYLKGIYFREYQFLQELIFAKYAPTKFSKISIAKLNSRENKFSRKLVLAKISTFKVP